jgi:hypothetical protein
MTDTVVDALVLDLLEWLAARERSWEDANERGLITREETDGRCVGVSSSGRVLLDRRKALPR